MLSVLVLVHEGGHFLAAKKAGVLVEEFGFGLPPRLLGIKRGETVYSLNLLPFGGFVRLYGEETSVNKNKERAFSHKDKKKRLGILLAGVLMNLILAVVIFTLVYSFLGIPEKANEVRIVKVLPGSPALEAGLAEGDLILSFGGEKITSNEEFLERVNGSLGRPINLEIGRQEGNPCQKEILGGQGGEKKSYSYCQDGRFLAVVVPRETPPEGEGPLGIVISDTKIQFYPFYQMIPKAIYNGFSEAFFWGEEIVASLVNLVKGVLRGEKMAFDVAGPVGIYQATGEIAANGFWPLAQFAGVLSVNLAILNVFPFPALDGGRVFFVLAEKVLGPKRRQKIEMWANQIGFFILLLLMILVTISDIRRLR
ncbi:site-2 protease family protein [Candidatus Shapirobacteria bacterium]|nr:site-2 protease family protein [Candidatus Shapirobacteria bacterium]